MRRIRLSLLCLLLVASAVSFRSVRAAGYQIRLLSPVLQHAKDAVNCSATGINDMGVIVGACDGGADHQTHGWITNNGRIFTEIEIDAAQVFPIPPQTIPPIILKRTTSAVVPKGINNSGIITGWLGYEDWAMVVPDQPPPGPGQSPLPPLPPVLRVVRVKLASFIRFGGGNVIGIEPDHAALTEVGGINDFGTIVGDFRSDVDNRFHGFIFNRSTGFTIVDAPGAITTALAAINNKDQIPGFCDPCMLPFVREGTNFNDLNIPRILNVQPRGINDHEAIVGLASINGQFVMFVYNRVTQALETITIPNARSATPGDIDNKGRVVGAALFNMGGVFRTRPFVATPN